MASVFLIRGQRVMLDSDVAALYQMPSRRFAARVRRNLERLPKDFMFRLSKQEAKDVKAEIGAVEWGRRRKCPLVFTELGVAMMAAVMNSPRAVQMNLLIVRAFVEARKATPGRKPSDIAEFGFHATA